MQNIIETLTKEKEAVEARIKTLKGEMWDLNLKVKSLEKAIKAIEPKKEN
jgi:chaperonin cofactor prefoldin